MSSALRTSRTPLKTRVIREGVLLAFIAALLLITGCAGLPRDVQRPPSQALPASIDTALGRIAVASTPDATLSGFRLLSWSVQSLNTRIELVRRAERSLDVQYYLIHDDETGRYLLRELRNAAARGVRVRLLLDDLYTAGSDPLLLGLAAHPNVELRLFNPFPGGRGSLGARIATSLLDIVRVNHRMHNKLLIADGAMAIAGGRNIGNEYFMSHGGANYIDLDAFAIGAVVPQLASLFDEYWNSEFVYPLHTIVRSEEPAVELQRHFDVSTGPQHAPEPELPKPGATDLLGQRLLAEEMSSGRVELVWAAAEAFADSPDKVVHHVRDESAPNPPDERIVRHNLMKELRLARREVLVTSPYLVPDRFVMEDIREGRLYGLRIALVTNSLASTDEPLVHAGYQRYRNEMLDLGVELYEVAPSRLQRSTNFGRFGQSIGRFHAKTAAIDGEVMFIGSLNFDPRSEKHNTELGLLIRSPQLTGQLLKLAELVKTEASYRVRLGADRRSLEWQVRTPDGLQTLHEEPETGFWQRLFLRLVAPFVPDEHL